MDYNTMLLRGLSEYMTHDTLGNAEISGKIPYL